ncbi:hypothetical protein [uncultured Clostridium sp.]|uniref:hypothetical protein n=1 Tax=uncultured Clostridium sp. TaxID=59620 RepID=UPI0026001F3A|nr:hypothetical protein [uncultured Clostridium sp.]MDU4882729.1 hypothetical protein [Clostridium celatum]MDU7076001.1 hypothetical protein [Clostridium celatum]
MNNLEVKNLVMKIMNEAYDKSILTNAEVFVNFYAHTKNLSIDIYPMGWDKRKEINNKKYEVNLEAKKWLKFKTIDEIIKALDGIYKEICTL